MKMIVAIIRPDTFEDVQAALVEQEVVLMTVSDVRGCGTQRGFTEQYRGNQGMIRLLPKIKLEIAVNDSFVQRTVEAIMEAAFTGNVGDGKIFVMPLDDCYRIRTKQQGSAAIGP